jgi:hypothetical protein
VEDSASGALGAELHAVVLLVGLGFKELREKTQRVCIAFDEDGVVVERADVELDFGRGAGAEDVVEGG